MVGTGKMKDMNSISQMQHLAVELRGIHSIVCPDFGRIRTFFLTPTARS
jgi:hypothetical protein